MRTLHIETGRQVCGGPLQVLYLMRGLMERGHEVSLICANGSGIEAAARESGIRAHPIRVLSDLDATIALRAYIIMRRVKPDVVHLHSRRGAELFGGLAARLARVPVVVLSRRIVDPVKLGILGRLKYILLPHKIVAISDGIRKALIDGGVDAKKIELVHSAIAPSDYQTERNRAWFEAEFGVPEDVPVIGSIARLIDLKGHRYLFAAIPEILKEFPTARFLLFGEGPLRSKLEGLMRDLGIEGAVTFAGFRTDIGRILPNLDLLVHPATREGLGVSLLQASSAGLPIIATAVGGIPEVVRDGSTGLLVPSEDVGAIVSSTLRLLRDRELARRLGENARRLAESEFSVDSMVEGNLRVYHECLHGVSWASEPQEVA